MLNHQLVNILCSVKDECGEKLSPALAKRIDTAIGDLFDQILKDGSGGQEGR